MSIDDLSRLFAAGGSFTRSKPATCFALAPLLAASLFIADAGHATAISSSRALESDSAAASLYVGVSPATNKASSSFTNRFDCSRPSFIAELLASPAFRAPRTKTSEMAAAPVVGAASTYNPHNPADRESGPARTSSGEFYDANSWTAAIQIDLRAQFGGVRFGRNYRPSFALVEAGDRRVVVRINDVGPLKPGRVIDLNDRTMRYFDPSMQVGLIQDVKVTPLAGEDVALGPVEPPQTMMAGDFEQIALAPNVLRDFDDHPQLGPLLLLR